MAEQEQPRKSEQRCFWVARYVLALYDCPETRSQVRHLPDHLLMCIQMRRMHGECATGGDDG